MLNWADFVILGIVALSVIVGVFRGFFRESVALASWILAFLAVIWFADTVATYFGSWIDRPGIAKGVATLAIFIGVLIVGAFVNYLITKLVKSSELSGTDRTLGSLFGLARGVAIVVGLILFLTISEDPQRPFFPEESWWQESVLIRNIEPYSRWAHQWLPESWQPYFVFDAPPPESPPAKSAAEAVFEKVLENQ